MVASQHGCAMSRGGHLEASTSTAAVDSQAARHLTIAMRHRVAVVLPQVTAFVISHALLDIERAHTLPAVRHHMTRCGSAVYLCVCCWSGPCRSWVTGRRVCRTAAMRPGAQSRCREPPLVCELRAGWVGRELQAFAARKLRCKRLRCVLLRGQRRAVTCHRPLLHVEAPTR